MIIKTKKKKLFSKPHINFLLSKSVLSAKEINTKNNDSAIQTIANYLHHLIVLFKIHFLTQYKQLINISDVCLNHIIALFRLSPVFNIMYFKIESFKAKMNLELRTLCIEKYDELFKNIVDGLAKYERQRLNVCIRLSDKSHMVTLQYHNSLTTEMNNFKKLIEDYKILINKDINYVDAVFITNQLIEKKYYCLKNILDILDGEVDWLKLNPVMQNYFRATLNDLKSIYDHHVLSEIMQLYKVLENEPTDSEIHNNGWTKIWEYAGGHNIYIWITKLYHRGCMLMPDYFFLITTTCTISFILIILFFLFRFIFKIILKNWKKKISTKIQLKKKTQKFFIKQKKII